MTTALPSTPEGLSSLNFTTQEFLEAIRGRRKAIRYHRDQKGDDRCWLDDDLLYAFLDDSPPARQKLPPFKQTMERCTQFYLFRRATEPDPIPHGAILDPLRFDEDLFSITRDAILAEILKIQRGIKKHRDVRNRPQSIYDDRELYALLPEKLPADFRLPARERFLGETASPHAGCPSFWRSHEACGGTCNLRRWGPCT